MKSLLKMSQSAMSRAIQCILISINYCKNTETVLSQIRKTTKIPPFRCGQKYVEMYSSSSNAAARNPEERVFYIKFTRVDQIENLVLKKIKWANTPTDRPRMT